MDPSSERVRELAIGLGTDLCGIAPAARFSDAPTGYHPDDVLPGCRSVIVFAIDSLQSTLSAKTLIPYTIMRNDRYARLDRIALKLSYMLELQGIPAIPIPAGEPCRVDLRHRKLRGIISLKHAAVFAGLGTMGKNTLLINDRYGSMLWLGAVLTVAELDPDPVAGYSGCLGTCRLCLESCPVKALDGTSIDQRKCGTYAFGDEKFLFGHYGGWRIKCTTCRTVCPHCTGIPEVRSWEIPSGLSV